MKSKRQQHGEICFPPPQKIILLFDILMLYKVAIVSSCALFGYLTFWFFFHYLICCLWWWNKNWTELKEKKIKIMNNDFKCITCTLHTKINKIGWFQLKIYHFNSSPKVCNMNGFICDCFMSLSVTLQTWRFNSWKTVVIWSWVWQVTELY